MQRIIQFFYTLICLLLSTNTQAAGIFGSTFENVDVVPPEKAFIVSQPGLNTVQIVISRGVYLYDDMTAVLTLDKKLVEESWRPQATMFDDPIFGMRPIHRGIFTLTLKNPPAEGILHFQGCADAGFCYPPIQTKLSFSR